MFQRGSIKKSLKMKKTIRDLVKSEYQILIFNRIFPLNLQIHIIAGLFGLDATNALSFAKTLPEEPNEGEYYLAFPRVSSVAREHFATITDPAKQYFATVDMLFKKFEQHIGLKNDNDMVIWELNQEDTRTDYRERYEMQEKTLETIRLTEGNQKGDILIISAQFGCLRVNQSVEQARSNLNESEFGLNMLMLGLVLFMHPYYIRDGFPELIAVGENIGHSSAPSFSYSYMESKFEHLRTEHIKFNSYSIETGRKTAPCTGFVI